MTFSAIYLSGLLATGTLFLLKWFHSPWRPPVWMLLVATALWFVFWPWYALMGVLDWWFHSDYMIGRRWKK